MPKKIIIEKNLLLELYIQQNLSIKEIAKKLKVSVLTILRNLKKYNIKKASDKVLETRKQTNLKKFGYEFAAQNKNCKEKAISTCMKKYGVKNQAQNEKIKEKIKNTCLKRYGVEVPSQNEDIKEKIKNTCLKKVWYRKSNAK